MAHRTKHFLLFIILGVFGLGGLGAFPIAGCGKGNGTAATGGTQSASSSRGGQSGSGGTAGSGSTSSSGGASGSGGLSSVGGSSATGGSSVGGSTATGGSSEVGGTTGKGGSSTGGTAGTGGGDGGTSTGGGAGAGGSGGNAGGGSGTPSGGQTGSGGSSSTGGAQSAGPRLIQNVNQSWKFKRADVTGAEATSFDDSTWSDIGLPHSFNLPYFMNAKFYAGYGWYRKHFSMPTSWSGKNVAFEFQAAFDQAQIYVNGKQVGEHIGGYNGFSIDITSAIKTGDNVVAVRLNNNWNPQIPPITGDHTFLGGLYRNVFMVVTDPLHVAWYGTWVTTPTLATNSGSSSTVQIKTEVQNNRSAAVTATLKTDIVDKDGKVVTTISSQLPIEAGKSATFDQTTPAINSPSLWHPGHPTMYKALSTL